MTELSDTSVTAPMEPTRNPDVTLPDLITVLLDKGTYLHIDLIIAVAEIPLIGINLRATIAGLEPMHEYGMMRAGDEKTGAWVRQSVARNFPLAAHEEIIAKMAGGHLQHDFSTVWRPGGGAFTSQTSDSSSFAVTQKKFYGNPPWKTLLNCVYRTKKPSDRNFGPG